MSCLARYEPELTCSSQLAEMGAVEWGRRGLEGCDVLVYGYTTDMCVFRRGEPSPAGPGGASDVEDERARQSLRKRLYFLK